MSKINVWIISICCDCLLIHDLKLREFFFLLAAFAHFAHKIVVICFVCVCANIKILFITPICFCSLGIRGINKWLFYTDNDTIEPGLAVVYLFDIIFVVVAVVIVVVTVGSVTDDSFQHNERSQIQVIHAIIHIEANFSNCRVFEFLFLLRFFVCSVSFLISYNFFLWNKKNHC